MLRLLVRHHSLLLHQGIERRVPLLSALRNRSACTLCPPSGATRRRGERAA